MATWAVLSVIAGVIVALLVAAALFDRRARAHGHHPRGGAGVGELGEFRRELRARGRTSWMAGDRGWTSKLPGAGDPEPHKND